MPRKHRSHSPSSSESESDRDDEERKEESGTSDSDSDSDAESSSGGSKSVDSSGSESEDSQERREVQYEQRHSQSLEKRVSGEKSREEIKQRDKDGGRRSRSSPRRSELYQRGSQEQGKRRSRSSSQGSFRGNERSYRDRRQSRSASPKSRQVDTGGRKPVSDSKSRSSATESKRSVEVRNRPQAQSGSSLLDSPSRKRSDTQSVESGRSNSRSQKSSSASRGSSLRNKNHKEPRSPSDSPRHRKDSPRGQSSSGQNHSRRRSSSRSPRQNKSEAERDRNQSTRSSPVSKGSALKSRVQGVQKGSKSMSASPLVDKHRQEQKGNPKSSSKSPAPAVDNIQDLKRSQKSDLKRRRSRSKSSSPEEQDSNSRSNKERKSGSVPKSPRQSSRTSKSSKDKLSRSRSKSREGQNQASVPTESSVKSSKELKKTPTEGKNSRSRSGSQSPHSRSRPQSANKQAKRSGDNSGRMSRSQSPKYQERSPKHKTLSSSVQIVRVSKKDREDSHESDDQSRSRSPVRRGLVDTRHDMRRFESEPESGEITSSDSDEEESTIPAIRSAVQKPRTPEPQREDRNNFSERETRDGFGSRKRHRFDNEEEEDRGGNRERRMDDRDSYSIRGEERDDYGLRKRPRYGDRERDDRDVARRRDEGSKSLPDDQKGEGERILGKRPAEENKENEVGKPETAEPAEKKAKTKGDILTGRTGGAYIPPAKLRAMQAAITDKSSVEYQRLSWEALKKSINGLVNKVNISNIINIVRELFQENIVRGRGLLARSIIQAQSASPTFTHVYAALVAIINTKFPQIGELILRRLVIQFKRGFKRNDKNICLSATRFIAHLVNQQMAHEVLSLEVLTLLLETPTDDSVEVSIGFLKECGQKLTEVSQRGINAIFERLRNILHEGSIDTRVQYMIEVMFAVRKDGFKDHPAVMEELDLVEESDQFTHLMTLEDANNAEDIINVFKPDPDFLQNEEKYKVLKKEILDEGSDSESEGGSGSDSGSGDSDSSEEDGSDDEEGGEVKQTIVDNTETNLVILRRTIYLTVQSSLDFEECAHKMMKMDLKPGQEVELCNMILDCCAQLRTYEKFFGLLAQRFCQIDKKYIEPFQTMFAEQYNTIHRLETNKLRNVAKFFGHLLFTDAISWGVLSAVRLNEEDTTSASRIFIKILFQELSEYMGLPKLNERLKDLTLQEYFEGLLPRDDPRKTRFAINFFTTIGLGGLTDDLRDHLKNVSKKLMQQKEEEEGEEESSSSSSDDDKDDDNDTSESDNSSSSDDSESDSDDSSAGSSSLSEEEQGKKKSTEKLGKTKDRQKERDKYNGVLKEKTESKDKKKKTDSDYEERTQREDKREWRRKEVENDVDGDDMDQYIRKKSDRNNRDTNSVRAELDSTRVSKRNRNVDKENDRVSDRDSRKKNNRGDFDNRVGGSGSREIDERDSDELRNSSKRRSRERTTDYVSPWERNKKEDKQNSESGSRDFRRRSRSLDRQRWDQNSSPKEVRRKERYRRSVSEENVNDVGRDSRRRR